MPPFVCVCGQGKYDEGSGTSLRHIYMDFIFNGSFCKTALADMRE